MLNGIKNKVDAELRAYARALEKNSRLTAISPLLRGSLAEFILRPGKRIRPALFVLGYLAYSRKPAPGLYKSALSFELLHDFMLVHDDIIDRSGLRRGKPSLHAAFAAHFKKEKKAKFSGQDLAIVAGDILYAMAVEAFLSIEEKHRRKEAALKEFARAAFFTGCGEFAELELGVKPLQELNESDIYRIYDLKTAYYSFAYPLSIGARLAGAAPGQVRKIFRYGVLLGRAFQILDDILGMFGEESAIGKSAISDLAEAKKTLLIWYAFRHSSPGMKREITSLLAKKKATARDLLAMRVLLMNSGALDYCRSQVQSLAAQAARILNRLTIPPSHKTILISLNRQFL